MLIYDGFESHLAVAVIDYCLSHKIIAFCLPLHSSHRVQPLDVGVFSPLNNAYGKRVNLIRSSITKEKFPRVLAEARHDACIATNLKSGFRKSGLHPYNPPRVLYYCLTLPEPHISRVPSPLPPPANQQHAQELLQFYYSPPTTPHSTETLYNESLSTITTNSPRAQKQRKCYTAFKRALEKEHAKTVVANEGESRLRQEIVDLHSKDGPDKRHVKRKNDSGRAEILERGNNLYKRRKIRDEEERQKAIKAELRKRVKTGPSGLLLTGEEETQKICPESTQCFFSSFPV